METTLDRAESERLIMLERLAAHARAALPDEPIPCFGYMQLERSGHTRDVLLGPRTVAEGPVTVLQWQTAPLAAVFFSTVDGDEYELEIEGRAIEGRVISKALFEFERGELIEVIAADAVFTRRDGTWCKRPSLPALLSPRDPNAPRLPPPWSLDALDAEQRRAVELSADRPLLVLGEAGCGKTTVALHRVAALSRSAQKAKRPFRALVLVPVEGLRRLSESLLSRFGASDVEVRVFDRWAKIQARRGFAGLPHRESHETLPGVMRLKRHPALRVALREIADRPRTPRAKSHVPSATRSDLLELFGDRVLLERVASASDGTISVSAVQQTLDHTRAQFRETSEQAFAHVTDRERTQAVDSLRLDAGTPDEEAGTIDAEDYAVLFALASMRASRDSQASAPETYDCVVIDEAQEFAPLELELIGRAVRRGGALIVAGDEGQQVDPTSYFGGWSDAMRELGAARHETVRLAVSYRCPPGVTSLARNVLRPDASREATSDASVVGFRAATACHLTLRMVDALRDVRLRDPQTSIAVICRTPESAARMAAQLSRGEDVRLVRDGDFRFIPGIEVTCVQDVKGLEFDHVLVPDVNAVTYPADGESRRALYVAVTRASVQLAVGAVGTWTPLLPAFEH